MDPMPAKPDDERAGQSFERALEAFSTVEHPVVVLAETEDGSVASLIDRLSDDAGPVVRAAAGPATKAKVGCLAEQLDLDNVESGVVVVEDAQWADPTSMGRLQRLIRSGPRRLLVIISHRSLTGVDAWGMEQLAATAERHASLFHVTVDTRDRPTSIELTEPAARDLVLAASLVLQPISVAVAARLLESSEGQALDLAESLVESGFLQETRNGFVATASASSLNTGEARRGHMAGRLASVLEENDGDHAVVGSLRLAAGDPAGAYPRLLEATRAAAARSAMGEAFHLAESALEAAEGGSVGSAPELGELHLVCGRYLRAAGRSEWAASHLERAASLLSGTARIDALGFAAAVADDRQHPQEAERILALAQWEATRQGETAKLGSLGTFHARALNRLGFAAEADSMLEKASRVLEGVATPVQRANAELNRAWILFDRGQVRRAEMEFTHLRDGTNPDDHAALADKEAWRARSLFAAGRPDEAVEAVSAARELAERAEVEAPLFLTDLALAEGNLLFGRHSEALAASERVLDLVERQLTAWENVARAERSVALLRLGRVDEAESEIASALAATPSGADGWRWRSRCQAIGMEIAAHAGKPWPQREAEDLADMLLQSEYYGWAADLMCVIAEQSKDPEVAREAMALALQIGNPLLAARAAAAGRLWNEPAAAPVIKTVRAMEARLPEGWEAAWKEAPGVAEALTAPEPTTDDAGAENAEVLDRALRRAGLAGADVVLSPAQRRSRGLVRRRRRRWSSMQIAAAVLGVVAVATLTSVAVAQLTASPPSVTVVREIVSAPAATAEAEPLSLEQTEIEKPEEFFFGVSPYRGGPARTGVVDAAGPRNVDGYFWRYETAGPIESTPAAYGRNLLVASTDGTLYAIDQTEGEVAWSLRTDGRITTSPEVATVEMGEGQRPALAVLAGDDGVVRARDAVLEVQSEQWSVPLRARVTSSPVIAEDLVVVATDDGFVHALSLIGGEEMWRYPAEGDGLGSISAPLTYADGVVYVGTEDGIVHLVETATGEARCSWDTSAGIVANPIVSDGAAYFPTRGNTIFVRPAGECNGAVPDRLPLYGTETPVEVPPAIRGDRMYLPSGQFLYSIDLRHNQHAWPASTVDAESVISAAPVVANDTVYFGTESGMVHAVDAETGEALWQWQTGNFVRASPVVLDGVVFIASGDRFVYALGDG